MKISCAILLVLALALTGRAAPAAASAPRDNFDFTQAGHHVKVWYHAPAGLGADAPVVFVMHGVGRNGEDYRNNWTAAADAHRFLLVVPEFSKAEFPGDDGYNYGNTVDKIGAPLPREPWSFNMIEPIFDAVRTRLGSRRANYLIFGHSAGAQFVQRLLYFVPQARVARAVGRQRRLVYAARARRRFSLRLEGHAHERGCPARRFCAARWWCCWARRTPMPITCRCAIHPSRMRRASTVSLAANFSLLTPGRRRWG